MMSKRGFCFDTNNIIENLVIFDEDQSLSASQKFEQDVQGIPEMGKYYDAAQNSVYFQESPVAGWVLNTNTWEYEPPTPDPSTDLNYYVWNESTESWQLAETRSSTDDDWEVV